MSARVLWPAAAALLAFSPGLAAAAESRPHFEIDTVFPRSETYLPADVFPIVIGVQNEAALRALGDDYVISWLLWASKSGLEFDRGEFRASDAVELGGDGNRVFVGYTNATDWVQEKEPGYMYALDYYIGRDSDYERCGRPKVVGFHTFSVEAPWETSHREWFPQDDDPKVRDPFDKALLELVCPEPGAVVEVRADAGNSSCPELAVNAGGEIDPCGITLDYGDLRDIRKIADKSSRDDAASATESEETEDEEDAAGGVGIPSGVMAAACALGWLAIAW